MRSNDINIATADEDRVYTGDYRFKTDSPTETMRVAAEFARRLGRGEVVAFHGELGSGKTTFIRGVCKELLVSAEVTSPTFTLIHEYNGRMPVYHFDFYRITRSEEIIQLGADEYFYGEGICLIEWADRVADYLPGNRYEVHLTHRFSEENENGREFLIRKL